MNDKMKTCIQKYVKQENTCQIFSKSYSMISNKTTCSFPLLSLHLDDLISHQSLNIIKNSFVFQPPLFPFVPIYIRNGKLQLLLQSHRMNKKTFSIFQLFEIQSDFLLGPAWNSSLIISEL